jgi:hypothetical protein
MAWRTAVSGLVLAAILASPPASSQPRVATDMELCTSACASHVDGDLSATADPLAIADGCFAPGKAYPSDRLVLTFPVTCLFWIRGR